MNATRYRDYFTCLNSSGQQPVPETSTQQEVKEGGVLIYVRTNIKYDHSLREVCSNQLLRSGPGPALRSSRGHITKQSPPQSTSHDRLLEFPMTSSSLRRPEWSVRGFGSRKVALLVAN